MYGVLEVNRDTIFSKKNLSLALLAKAIPPNGSYAANYGELLSIIDGYIMNLGLSEKLLLESDSFLAVRSLLG